MEGTRKLYLDDGYLNEFEALVLATIGGWSALSQTAFHPGGGGQPADTGYLIQEAGLSVSGVREDSNAGRSRHGTYSRNRRIRCTSMRRDARA